MNIHQTVTTLVQDGFILVFNLDKLDVVKTAEALLEAGVRNMEVTCRIKKPLEKIQRLRKALPDFSLGAASLIDYSGMLSAFNRSHSDDPLPSVEQVVDAGVDFIVSAVNFRPETYQQYAGKLAMIPGCGSSTEIVAQFNLGANLCKLFPAKIVGGPEFIAALDPAIHKFISIVPTGGTDMTNIGDYIRVGVLTLGASFSMIDRVTMAAIVENQDYALLAQELKKMKKRIDDCRREKWPKIDFSTADMDTICRVTGRLFNLPKRND